MERWSLRASVVLFQLVAGAALAEEEAPSPPPSPPSFVLAGYVEANYQWNFNRPINDITNYRGFDNRHNTFTLANAVLDAQADYENTIARLAIQVGHTPATYYSAEPQREGASGANASDSELWRYLQQAYVGYRALDALTLTMGLFLSPIGPESMAIKDSWNWSRSNLFVGLPFYHTGARASYATTGPWSFTLAAYNGWNSVVDNNRQKSLSAQAVFSRSPLTVSLLYVGGVERAPGALEGTPWRHLYDAYAVWDASSWLALIGNLNAGFERGELGNARWFAGAGYARVRFLESLFVALRADFFREHVPSHAGERASPMFWPVAWVSSATATLDYRPTGHISIRAEYRHDQASDLLFFGRHAPLEPSGYVANRRAQNTLTLGTTAWF
jgi:hypothetical protein